MREASLGELAQSSAVIVHGIVSSVSDAPADTSAPFHTVIEVAVTEAVKGLRPGARSFRFELPGGRSGDYTMYVPGVPRFTPGDEVVLLLEAAPGGGLVPAGLAQGVFHVERREGVAEVKRRLAGATYVDGRGRIAAPPPVPARLDDLMQTLRAAAGNGGTP